MSFYGNSYSEFQKFFQNFIFKNTKNSFTLTPQHARDDLSFTGDKWINFSQGNNLSVQISHTLPEYSSTEASRYMGLETTQKDPKAKKLSAGEFIKVPIVSYDKMGHLWKVEYQAYQLPQTQTEIDYSNLMNRTSALEEKSKQWDQDKADISNLQSNFSKIEQRTTSLENQGEKWNEINALKAKIGDFAELKIDTAQKLTNLIKVLGPVLEADSYNKTLSTYLNEKEVVERSISEALSEIIGALGHMDTEYTIMKELYTGLLHRVEALEKK